MRAKWLCCGASQSARRPTALANAAALLLLAVLLLDSAAAARPAAAGASIVLAVSNVRDAVASSCDNLPRGSMVKATRQSKSLSSVQRRRLFGKLLLCLKSS